MLIVDVDVGVLWVKLRTSELSVSLSLGCSSLPDFANGKWWKEETSIFRDNRQLKRVRVS
jgi:hypothetical protein